MVDNSNISEKDLNLVNIDINQLQDNYVVDRNTVINIRGALKGEEIVKKRITIVHNKKDIRSRINIKTVVFDNSKLDIEVILLINKGAKNCDTYLKIDCLVIGEHSYARVIPSLEILENEVKGGHGATIGYLDDNQLNYLYSRGLSKNESEKLLVEAFLR